MIMAYEDEQGQLQFPIASPVIQVGNMDTAGRLRPFATNAAGEITEENSNSIDNHLGDLEELLQNFGREPMFGTAPTTGAGVRNAQLRINVIPIVTDAAGDSAVVELVATSAGNNACIRLLYIYADGTDAAWDVAFTVTAGTLEGIPDMTGLATTVNVIGPDWTPGGLLAYASDDAATISAQIANGGNVITYYFVYVWWHEDL